MKENIRFKQIIHNASLGLVVHFAQLLLCTSACVDPFDSDDVSFSVRPDSGQPNVVF
ncbi:hypothetical protein [Shewanella pealeana]|uniref:hypothetical protein n=1 Tax=Shewanella pealeana TaxID=70864 RepID=UPI00167F25D3|nr:hypothetical protein [Shewanella pealeana]